MSYSLEKDDLIKMFEMKQEGGSIQFLVMSYEGGKPKLQITRMYEKKDGSVGYSRVGRLNEDEIKFFLDHGEEILELVSSSGNKETHS